MEPKLFLLLLLIIVIQPLRPRMTIATGGSTGENKKVPAVFMFGDSTVDTGNNNAIDTLLKSNFMPYGRDFMVGGGGGGGGRPTGRFSNGRIASDFYSEAFGLGLTLPAYLDPELGMDDLAAGACFASAGTGLDNTTSAVMSVIPMWKEVEYFEEYRERLAAHLGGRRAARVIREAVYIVSVGTNDLVENYFSPVSGTGRREEFPDVGDYVEILVSLAAEFVARIHRVGARKVGFTGMAPVGCVPLERSERLLLGGGGGCAEEHNAAARAFNAGIVEMMEGLSRSLEGIRLVFLPIYELMESVVNNPSLYGFEVADEGCCGTGMVEVGYLCSEWNPFVKTTCDDADKYVFWDAVHPTEKMSHIATAFLVNSTQLRQFL